MDCQIRDDTSQDEAETYQPETLHVVPARRRDLCHVIDGRVSKTALDGSMIDERAEHLPPPLTVYLISRNTPHVKQALYCFWSLQVMRVR